MNKWLILLCSVPLFLNAQFLEDFSNGNFSAPQNWQGNEADFIVNDTFWLQLNAPEVSDEKYVSTALATQGATTWRFKLFYDFENPSSSNFARFYLQSSNSNLTQNLNGYFIQIGGISGSDDAITLNKQNGTVNSEILSSALGIAAANQFFNIEVIRDENYLWTLNLDLDNDGNFNFESSASDSSFLGGNYLGPYVKFSSSRHTAYLFDDIYVDPIYIDSIAPLLQEIQVINAHQIDLKFNEVLEILSAESNSNYTVNNGIGNPSLSILDANLNVVHLYFNLPFLDEENYTLTFSNIQDLQANSIGSSNESFTYFEASKYDILITEIFADENPSAGLPQAEYLEIYNNTAQTIDLHNFTLEDASSETSLDAYALNPDGYLILCAHTDVAAFEIFGNVLGVSSFPSLNNSSDMLSLKNSEGQVLNAVKYSSAWYKDAIKSEGGYSLEMIDLTNYCEGENNWIASNAAIGGTPGNVNSVNGLNPDLTNPYIESVQVVDDKNLKLLFNEDVDRLEAVALFNYSFNPVLPIDSINYDESLYAATLTFDEQLQLGISYTLSAQQISDCAGNHISAALHQFGLPETAEAQDIVINEILFNPVTGGSDYVELYNRSAKIFDLSELKIAKADTATEIVDHFEFTSTAPYLFFPNTYLALTEDKENLLGHYLPSDSTSILEMNDLPTYYDKEGIVVVLNSFDEEIDRVSYFEDWHFELIDDKNGVALERLDFDGQSSLRSNWHSASSLVNFGTPGYKNSQFISHFLSQNLFEFNYKVISPNADGFQDFLAINFSTDEPGWIANIIIFDQRGRHVTYLARNELLAAQGFIKWDGSDSKGEKIPSGIYVVYIELFDLNGNLQKYKESCAVYY